ncbi:MAG: hypothetical protein KAR55_00345 [Thermoplasmatales archaeon]|nr:hypothetical protein [Thermoplasmatales archaeon]
MIENNWTKSQGSFPSICVSTYIARCEKGIYETSNLNADEGGAQMLDNCSNTSISIENAFTAREILLDNLLINHKPDLKSVMTNISKKEREHILEKIYGYELSKNVIYFSDKYEKYFKERNTFLWKFLGAIFTESGATLSSVDKKYFESVTDIKIIISILCGILDDVADVHKDTELLNKMVEVLNNKQNENVEIEDEKISFIKEIWDFLLKKIKKLPRYDEFKDIFMYDFKQFINAFEYSCLINKNPNMICLKENENYDAHNMMVFIFNGIDLMASPTFNKDELPHLRTVFWHAQKMARIGNWLSTWKRELKQNDLCSGVFTYAISKKILNENDLKYLPKEEIISKIEESDVYEFFMKSWEQNHEKLISLKGKIGSIDMDSYINGLGNVMKYHLSTGGLK